MSYDAPFVTCPKCKGVDDEVQAFCDACYGTGRIYKSRFSTPAVTGKQLGIVLVIAAIAWAVLIVWIKKGL